MATAVPVTIHAPVGERAYGGYWPPGSIGVNGEAVLGDVVAAGSLASQSPSAMDGAAVLADIVATATMTGGSSSAITGAAAVGDLSVSGSLIVFTSQLTGSSTATVDAPQRYTVTVTPAAVSTISVQFSKDGSTSGIAPVNITAGNTQATYDATWSAE
ncbi:MAG: hypothetical protein RL375_1169, partial [Pseudomonadota bacterium]